MMSDAILELQQELLKSDCDISSVLKKAHKIAYEKHMPEFDTWIMSELKGYAGEKDVPDYRTVSGKIKTWDSGKGWVQISIDDKNMEKCLCSRTVTESVSEISRLCETSEEWVRLGFTDGINDIISSMRGMTVPKNYSLQIGTYLFKLMLNRVQNRLLEWTMTLEYGKILGADDHLNHGQEQRGTEGHGNKAPACKERHPMGRRNDETDALIEKIREAVIREELFGESGEIANALIGEVETKAGANVKPDILRASWIGLMDFLFRAGANNAGTLIAMKFQK